MTDSQGLRQSQIRSLIKFAKTLVAAFKKLWESIKTVATALYKAVRRHEDQKKAANLEAEIERLTHLLEITRKTVARNRLLRRRAACRNLLRQYERGEDDGQESHAQYHESNHGPIPIY